MIEAVNSVLSKAPLVRPNAEQASGASSSIANLESVRQGPKAPYVSPYIRVDVNFDTAVLLLRDSDTGDTVQQIPSEGRLEERRRLEAFRQTEQLRVQTSVSDSGPRIQAPAPVTTSTVSSTAALNVEVQANAPNPVSAAVISAFASGAATTAPASGSAVNVSA